MISRLGTENFFMAGKSLNIDIQGITLVFFKSERCQGCAMFDQVFNQIAKEDRRLNYATIDLSHHQSVVQMSKSSTTEIRKVPHVILYDQGRPHARFTGDKTIKGIRDFLGTILPSLLQRQPQASFVQPQQGHNSIGHNNPYGNPGGYYPPNPQIQPPTQQQRPTTPQTFQNAQNQCDPDDEECLMMPSHITPYNMPWETEFKKIAGEL